MVDEIVDGGWGWPGVVAAKLSGDDILTKLGTSFVDTDEPELGWGGSLGGGAGGGRGGSRRSSGSAARSSGGPARGGSSPARSGGSPASGSGSSARGGGGSWAAGQALYWKSATVFRLRPGNFKCEFTWL